MYGPNGTGFSNVDPTDIAARVSIDFHEAGQGDTCTPGDWTTVHWTATLLDGRVVSDSRAEPGGLPKTFALGAHEVFSCWDYAVSKMKKGSKATVGCPYDTAWGNAFTWAPLGGEPIPLHSDVDFEIEVVDCNRVPDFTQQVDQPITTTMQPGRCMYLHLEESDNLGREDLVLTSQGRVNWLTHWNHDDANQQWVYDENTKHIMPFGDRNRLLGAERSNGDSICAAAGDAGLFRTEWYYNPTQHTLSTNIEGSTMDDVIAGTPHYFDGEALNVVPRNVAEADNRAHRWRITYCSHAW